MAPVNARVSGDHRPAVGWRARRAFDRIVISARPQCDACAYDGRC